VPRIGAVIGDGPTVSDIQPLHVPLFAYGSLRPGQLAYRQIERYVAAKSEAELHDFTLYVRDGLPFAHESSGNRVLGQLITPRSDEAAQFWTVVDDYEPSDLYWRRDVTVRTTEAMLPAVAYLGRSITKGAPVAVGETWSAADDPLFGEGLRALRRLAQSHFETVQPMSADIAGFWEAFLPLQGLYMSLTSVLERFTAMAFGPKLKPGPRITRLRDLPEAQRAVEQADPPRIVVFRSLDLKPYEAPGPKAFDAWYAVRSNLTHRGKADFHDFALVEKGLVGLHDTMRLLLRSEVFGTYSPELDAADDGSGGPLAPIARGARDWA
jgi:gamma-glutamylcyclotransferase (GGCT)/AIG2-like uncharacterized protein YtfP